jgi:hypothetical protein
MSVTKLLPGIPEKQKAWPVKVLRNLQGKVVDLETPRGTKSGKVKVVMQDKVTITRAYSVNGQILKRDETIPLTDLLASTREKYKLDWKPGTDDETAAAAMVALSRDRAGE